MLQGIIEQPMAYNCKPCPGSVGLCNNSESGSSMYMSYTSIVPRTIFSICLVDVCSKLNCRHPIFIHIKFYL
jgi:hypothetical protein